MALSQKLTFGPPCPFCTVQYSIEHIPHMHFASGVTLPYLALTGASCSICIYISTRQVVHMSRKHMACSGMGTVNGCGYNGQPKDAICDTHGPCRMIQSTLKRVFLSIST